MMTKPRERRVGKVEETVVRRMADDDVTASEIAAFAYCAKAWHLERVVGAPPSAAAARARAAGTTHHVRHETYVGVGGWLGRNSRWLVVGLLLLAFLLAALSMMM